VKGVPGRRNIGLTMGQILKFPDSASRRALKRGMPREAAAATVTRLPSRHVPMMTGDQWNEFMRLLMPDEQLAFMADVWKVMAQHLWRMGGH
jgi:hypothetical protein